MWKKLKYFKGRWFLQNRLVLSGRFLSLALFFNLKWMFCTIFLIFRREKKKKKTLTKESTGLYFFSGKLIGSGLLKSVINAYIQTLCIKLLLSHIHSAQASKGLHKRKTKVEFEPCGLLMEQILLFQDRVSVEKAINKTMKRKFGSRKCIKWKK